MLRTAALVSVIAAAACGGGGGGGGDDQGDDAPGGIDAAPAPYCSAKAGTALRLTRITNEVVRPVAVAAPAGDPRLFVVEQPGRISVIEDGARLATPFLTIEVNDVGDEQGLLGLAFHPAYASNGRFFVFYVQPGSNDLRIAEYHATPSADVADAGETVILDIPHGNADNHNGGTLAFGPDGRLYASVGDGGGANDFYGHGQNPDSHLAKVLRIDVDGAGGIETYAWGLRNPWKIAFDSATGDLWIGDVGQGAFEEVDVVRAGAGGTGANFGWPIFEGPECFTADEGGDEGCDRPGDFDAPFTAYDRRGDGNGCSVVVAAPYRGACMPDLRGLLFVADYCTGEVHTLPSTGAAAPWAEATRVTTDLDPERVLEGRLSGFGVDGYAELYVTSLAGEVYRIEVE